MLGAATFLEAHRRPEDILDVGLWVHPALQHVSGASTHGLAGAAALLHAANVLLALAAFVRFLLVAVDEAVGSDGATTGLAGLAARVGRGNLTAILEALFGDRAHARLHVRVQRLGGRPVRAVNLLVLLTSEALGLAPHGLAGLFCHLIHARSPRKLRASPLLPERIAWATSSLPGY